MRGAAPFQGTTHYDSIRKIQFRNNSGETIPPYAVMQFTGGFDANEVPYVSKPDEDSTTTLLCFNLGVSIEDGEYGWGTCETPNWVAYADDGSGSGTGTGDVTPAPRDVWGTEANSWYLHSDQTGFVIIGVVANDSASQDGVNRVYVMLDPLEVDDGSDGGGSGGTVSHEFLECHPETGQTRTTTFTFPVGVVTISSTEWS